MSAASRFGRLRRPAGNVLGLAGAGAAAATGVVYWQQHNRQLQLDAAYKNDPVLKTPKLSWVPPTREEMLGALRKSAMLPKKFEPTDDLAQARNVKVPQIGDADEGYDLLVRPSSEMLLMHAYPCSAIFAHRSSEEEQLALEPPSMQLRAE